MPKTKRTRNEESPGSEDIVKVEMVGLVETTLTLARTPRIILHYLGWFIQNSAEMTLTRSTVAFHARPQTQH
jgi:hypothetical protein